MTITLPEAIGSAGVFILLLAFFLNLFKKVSHNSKAYLLMNFSGAAVACYASWMIKFIPFVILEGAWSLVSLLPLLRNRQK